MEKWSFRNASPSSKSNCFDDTDSPSLFLYQDWILDFQRVALDLSLDSLSKDKLQILRIHTEIPFQLLFSTCVIASDLYLSSLNIIFNGGLYSAIDFSKMKVISSLAKTVGQVTEQLGKKLISPNRVVYVLWGKLERENVSWKYSTCSWILMGNGIGSSKRFYRSTSRWPLMSLLSPYE